MKQLYPELWQTLQNKKKKHNLVADSSPSLPGALSTDCIKWRNSGDEMNHSASFMMFGLRNTSQLWCSMESGSSSDRRMKSCSIFEREYIKQQDILSSYFKHKYIYAHYCTCTVVFSLIMTCLVWSQEAHPHPEFYERIIPTLRHKVSLFSYTFHLSG